MGKSIRLVVSCTDRKRMPASRELQLRNHPNDLDERAERWVESIANSDEVTLPAAEMYKGEHWSVVEEATRSTVAGGLEVELWIASAGYGLIRGTDHIASYGATFATGSPDSVTRKQSSSDPSLDAAEWWNHLIVRKRKVRAPSSITELAAADTSSPILLALSSSYVRAVESDLLQAADLLDSPGQLLLVSAGSSKASLNHVRVPTDARFQHAFGGSRLSLNIRVAKHVIENSPQHNWNGAEVRQLLERELAQQPDVVQYHRKALSDDAVRKFIAKELSRDSGASQSRLLRRLRDRNLACEQKRFGQLYLSVREGVAT